MQVSVIGAFKFGLTRNDDGTYVSTCLGPADETPKPTVKDEVQHFVVPSHSDPTVEYNVDLYPDGLMHCECVGWGFRHDCSHCDDVRALLAKEAKDGQN